MKQVSKMGLLIMLAVIGAGCTPVKEVMIYPESERYQIDNTSMNEHLSGKKAIITLISRERVVGTNLFVENDTLTWQGVSSGLFQTIAFSELKTITMQERFADPLIGFSFGAVLGVGLSANYRANHFDDQETRIAVGIATSIAGGYGALRLLSLSNERTRYIIVQEESN